MSQEAQPFRVAIIGGGIAGLALAVGLIRRIEEEGLNLDLGIYEQAPKFAEIGAGVALGPNALRSLRLLGLQEQMKILGNCPKETEDLWFEYRFAEKSHPQSRELITSIVGKSAGQGYVHRAMFLDSLIEVIPQKYCHFDHRFTSYRVNDDCVTVSFAHNNTVKDVDVDLVVACDGIKSPIRKVLYKSLGSEKTAPREKYAEWIAWRGLIPEDVYKQAMGRSGAYPIMWCGLDRHILTFPVKRGEMVNIVGFVHDTQRQKINGQTAPWAEERPKAEMLQDFEGFDDGCIAMLEAIERPSVWGIFDLPPLDVVDGTGVILAGDAAHATTPHQGSGAGQAIEDALFLSRMLTSPALVGAPTRSNLAKAQQIYQGHRKERAAKVQVTSAQAGLLYEGRGVNGEGQDLGKMRESLEQRMRWIWDYDLEANISEMLKDITAALSV